ncbi:T9SS type A sorting domain-containing protein [Marinoscillum furvescens]|uniref:Putative secreted protein (Por secretion system target) n=1 Tax=Marinoscillum furvescens DSM 4134 TaxID=1122208 RepID=A0A3D9L2P6_MARFU|nr:T9SS type A sorting domain-containing protein [Marinoscillum furvescens]RED96654.1 putative secreted protein (Por secretion system target) [Marinoscillum furvescens DSM 4134]
MKALSYFYTFFLAITIYAQTGPGGVGNDTNVRFWYRANSINQANSTSVSSWSNDGGNTKNAEQSTGSEQPTFLTNQINGFPALSFDGTNDNLGIANDSDLNNGGPWATRTFYMVIRTGANVTNRQMIFEEGGGTRGLNIYIFNGNLYFGAWNEANDGAGSPWGFSSISTAISTNTTYILTYVMDGNNTSTGTITGYLDGTQFGTINNVGLLYNHNSTYIGGKVNSSRYETGSSSGSGDYFSGLIAEWIIQNDVPNFTERVATENYLAAKYGLSIANDYYTMDNVANGNYDYEVAGLGQFSAGDNHTDSQGSSIFRFSNPGGLGNFEYFGWGHDNGDDSFTSNTSDIPSAEGIGGRMDRLWRPTMGGTINSFDLTVSISNSSCVTTADNLFLLVDLDNDGTFADETVSGGGVIQLTDIGGGDYQITNLTIMANGRRFTIGIDGKAPTSFVTVPGPGGVGDDSINRFWFDVEDLSQTDNTTVQTWTNKGGTAENFFQNTVSARPLYRENQQNGVAQLVFDGINDFYTMNNNNDLNLGGPAYKRSFVVQFTTGVDVITRQVIFEEGGASRGLNIYIFNGELYIGGWNLNDDGADAPWGFVSTATTVSANTDYIVTYIFDGNSCLDGTITMYLNGAQIGQIPAIGGLYEHTGDIGLGAKYNDTYYENGGSNNDGDYFSGAIGEFIAYNVALNNPQRILIENYLSSKFDIALSTNDFYDEDGAGQGDYDFDVAGIGRENALAYENDGQGEGILRMRNPSDLGDDEYLIWGHNNALLEAGNESDVPAGVEGRLHRVWRMSETNSSGSAVDVGSVDIRWDLSAFPSTNASDLALLIDTDNDGTFADETAIFGATDLGGGVFEFAGVTGVVDGRRMTLGSADLSQTSLPVDLLSFDVKIKATNVEISWKTASELNNDYFTIEKSRDGITFITVAQLIGAGTHNAPLSYTYTDTNPGEGLWYYRLKQTDFDGTTEVFEMRRVEIAGAPAKIIQVFPNPTSDFVTLSGAGAETSIFDAEGTNLNSEVQSLVKGENIEFDFRGLENGVYYIRTNAQTLRVIKR